MTFMVKMIQRLWKRMDANEQYKSIDVYKAVMENGVKSIDEFLALYN